MKKAIILLKAIIALSCYAHAQSASTTWALNATATVSSTVSGKVTNVNETVGSYFTSDVSYLSSPACQSILLNHKGVSTTLAGAHTNSGYVEFKISPLDGQALTVKTVSLNMGGDNNSFLTSIEYSVNADFSNSTVIAAPTGVFPVAGKMYPLSYTLPGVLLSPGQTFYLRIYASHSQTAARYLYINNLVIGGTVATDAGNVTVVDNGTTVTLNNGIVSAVITKATGNINTFNYNGANVLAGGYAGGMFYWSWNMPNYQNPEGCTYTLTANPSANSNSYAAPCLRSFFIPACRPC